VDISIIVPVYKEEKSIVPFLHRIIPVLNKMSLKYEIIFCLDPCPDNSESILENICSTDSNIKLLVFSRRFGQPAATIAGLKASSGRACVVIDIDLQDPPELIPDMFSLLGNGTEVVYAKRRTRKGETFIKRFVSYVGYSVINKLSDVDIPRNTGDFRILSRTVVDHLNSLKETNGFLRGLVAFVGFEQRSIEYDRDMRFIGSGNYNIFVGSLKIGLNGLIGFSSKPLLIMSISGLVLAFLSFMLGLFYVCQKLAGVELTPGLSTTVLVVSFLSGVQLLGLGLIGEYVGRIYDEVKGRPMFIIKKQVNFHNTNI
jgi:polyisoprenyl-phosphate glycosyltransferase